MPPTSSLDPCELSDAAPSRGFLVVLGLSRGGTNLLAHRLHDHEGVLGLDEWASRLLDPRAFGRPGEAVWCQRRAHELQPPKGGDRAPEVLCLNKVNYALPCPPGVWLEWLLAREDARAIVLVRHPRAILRSRRRWTATRTPQRTGWLLADRLAREWSELCRFAGELLPTGRAVVRFHELLARRPERVGRTLGELFPGMGGAGSASAAEPDACPACGGELRRVRRFDWDPNEWLRCAACGRYVEGPGQFNRLRTAEPPPPPGWSDADADVSWMPPEMLGLCDAVADGAFEADPDAADAAFGELLRRDADRWCSIPMDDLLYPY